MSGLFKPKVSTPPPPVEIKQPMVEQATVDRNAADLMRRRKGTADTITGASGLGSTSGSVAAKTLLGQ